MLSPFFVPIAGPLQWKWKKGSDHLGKGVLWNYGDSLMLYFHRSIRNAPLCKQLFAECSVTYAYVYPFNMVTKGMKDKDFNQELVISGIRKVLSRPDMNNPQSALVLNLGLHFMKTLNFSTYQKLLEGVIGLLRETTTNGNGDRVPKYNSKFIWKTSTAIHKENGKFRQSARFRFYTLPVRNLRRDY